MPTRNIAEIPHDPKEWWGYHVNHGWVVLDRDDPRNVGGFLLTFVRCRDWVEVEITRDLWDPPVCTFFRNHLGSLPAGDGRDAAVDALLSLRQEYAARKPDFRARGDRWLREKEERQRKEAEEAEERRRREAEDAERIRLIAIALAHGQFLTRKGVENQGLRVAGGRHRVTHCYCVAHPPLDNAVHYECSRCNGIICPLCGGCFC
jgi:hypothetical protein